MVPWSWRIFFSLLIPQKEKISNQYSYKIHMNTHNTWRRKNQNSNKISDRKFIDLNSNPICNSTRDVRWWRKKKLHWMSKQCAMACQVFKSFNCDWMHFIFFHSLCVYCNVDTFIYRINSLVTQYNNKIRITVTITSIQVQEFVQMNLNYFHSW